jgi:4'-phosphopantetheinyl transferase
VIFLGSADFVEAAVPPSLGDEIHLWFFPQQSNVKKSAESAIVRNLLAHYAGRPADSLTIDYDALGKPALVGADLHFNLSHSGQQWLVGVSRDQPLGVDIESGRKKRSVLELADRFFAPSEAIALRSMPETIRHRAFLDLWSCKEAVVKALGTGLRFGLDRVAFELNINGAVSALSAIASDAGSPDQWQLARLAPDAAAIGALAWCGRARVVRAFTSARL